MPPISSSPGLERAIRAAGSPRRAPSQVWYELVGAQRERRRLIIMSMAIGLGLLVTLFFLLWERHYDHGYTYSHWDLLGGAAGNDYDQGAYVVSAQLLLKGYALFNPVFSAQPAFFLPTLAAIINLINDPIRGGFIYIALCGVLTLGGVFWLAWSAFRPLAAPFAIAALAVSPGFLLYGHAVEAEMPMLAFCTLSVAAAQSYYRNQRRWLAVLTGLALMAGTEMKFLSVVVVLPLAIFLLAGAWQGRQHGRSIVAILLDALSFVLAVALPALIVLVLFSPSDQWRQIFTFHTDASRVMPLDLNGNMTALRTFLSYDPGLLLLALTGTIVGLWRSATRFVTVVYALWFITTYIFLWRYHPLLQHQFIPLLPPLALLAAASLGRGEIRAPVLTLPLNNLRLSSVSVASGLVVLVYLVITGVRTLDVDNHILTPSYLPNRDALVALVKANTKPGDFIAADDPMVALEAGRLLPPGLEDPSMVRMTAGYLTDEEAIAALKLYRPTAIVLSRPGGKVTTYQYFLPSFITWISQHYHHVLTPFKPARIFLP